MLPVSQQRAAHVALVEELRRAMAVINGQHKSPRDAPPDFRDPIARFEPRFRVLAFVQCDALRRKIFVDRARGNRRDHIYKFFVVATHTNFLQHAFAHHHAVHGQRVDQFIRENAARGNLRCNLRRNPQAARRRVAFQSRSSLLAPRR